MSCSQIEILPNESEIIQLRKVVSIEGVDWKIVVPIVLGVAAVAVGCGLIFYFTYYRKLKQKRDQSENPKGPSLILARRMKK